MRAFRFESLTLPPKAEMMRHKVRAFLDEDSISYSVMTRNAAGELSLHCVTGANAAKDAMVTPATTETKGNQHEAQ